MPDEYTFSAALLDIHGDTRTIIDRQTLLTVGGAPLDQTEWTVVDAAGDPLGSYSASRLPTPSNDPDEEIVYYRASNHRRLFGPSLGTTKERP